MIGKLRKKFILLALAVVTAVILVIVAGIDIATYAEMKADADATIAFLEIENAVSPQSETPQGEVPMGDLPQNSHPQGDLPQDAPPQGDLPQGNAPQPPQGGSPAKGDAPTAPIDGSNQGGSKEFGNKPKGLPNETKYSARYFTVETDEDGKILVYDLGRIAFVSEEDISGIVSDTSGEKGFAGNYRYLRRETDTGYHYFFLDCEKEIDATRTFVIDSAIITAIGLAVIALLIILLSKKVLAPVEESYKKQKQFITDAGHELKTPLTVIGANAELLELEIGEDNEWLKSIKGQVQKLAKLTKELVFLSRMDETDRVIEKAPFSLKSALEDCAEGFREAALVAGKEIRSELDEVEVNANEEMIRRAVNLALDNAIKYSSGSEIRLTLAREGKWAIISESNEADFAKGEHPELFERFYRPDSSRNAVTGGHGIGLSVVRSILEAHGGTATCASNGKILTFRFALPLS